MTTSRVEPNEEMRRYYREMSRARRAIVLPLAIVSAGAYLALNALANFTSLLDAIVFPGMSLAYLFGFAQMLISAVIVIVYKVRIDKVEREHRPSDSHFQIGPASGEVSA